MNVDDLTPDHDVSKYVRKPRSPEWAAEEMRTVLFEARQLAVQHRDELLDQGFDRDDANHIATGALYDVQSNMLRALWPDE